MALTLSGTNKIVNDNLNTEVKTLFTPKNWIINGGFDVWQRGTSQTSNGYGSDDRWKNGNNITTKTHSLQTFTVGQTVVPNNPTCYSRTVVVSGNTNDSLCTKVQWIEDVTKLAGKIISLSFWAKADASKNMSINFAQSFGTGGSSTVYEIGVQKLALTTSWQRFTKTLTLPSVSGKTIGTGSALGFYIFFDAGSSYNSSTDSLGNQSGTFDIANVSLVEGSVPVEWQTEAYADVLRQCQRYYWRIGGDVANNYIGIGLSYVTTNAMFNIQFPIKMRGVPSLLEYSNLSIHNIGVGLIAFTTLVFGGETSSFSAIVNAGGATGLTAGKVYGLLSTNINGYIGFNAEL